MKSAVAPACLACDTDTKLTASSATALAAAVYVGESIAGVCRYVSISQPREGDIDTDEANAITAAGLGLWLIQHPLNPGWAPSGQLGDIHGTWAARNATQAGYPEGCHLGIDLEGVKATTPKQDVIDYIAERVQQATAVGYPSVLYCGFESVLSAIEESELPTVHLYWSDFAFGRTLPGRGFVVRQFAPNITLAGVQVDMDRIVEKDNLGGQLVWAVAD